MLLCGHEGSRQVVNKLLATVCSNHCFKKPVPSCGQSFICGLTDGNFLLFMIHPILKNPFHHDAMLEMMGVFLRPMTVVQLKPI